MANYSVTKLFHDEWRSSRLAALFAILFIITLLIAISFITIIALLSDGFSTLTANQNCSTSTTPSPNASSFRMFTNGSYCNSPECIRLAANYLNNMNTAVNPCSDFYEFACGRYSTHKIVPLHEKKVTILSEMKQDLDRHLRDILEKSPRDNATRSMKLSQIYYDSCMDEEAQEEMNTLPLTSLISHLGGWELLTNARFDSNDYHWETLGGHLSLYGVDGLFRIFVHNSFVDSKNQMLMFSPPRLFLEKKKFYREAPAGNVYLGYYRKYILSLLELLGVDMEDESGVIEYQVNDIIDFERRIANLTRIENSRNHTSINNVMKYGEFKKRYHQIDWDLFFNSELRSHVGILSDNLLINVVDTSYFDNISALIKSKPLSSVNNYLMWRLVSTFDTYLPPKYRIPYQEFRSKMYGVTAEIPLWEKCVKEVREHLAMPLSTAYAHLYFTLDDRQKAEEMIADLRQSMEQTVLNADWIDEGTRHAALRKIEKMKYKIGFPDSLLNETSVLMPFAGVRLTGNQFFENALTLKKTAVREILAKAKRAPSEEEWASPIIAVDAFHFFTGNEIIFPAGILQFPMFVPDAPSFANYGSIGMGIGHEITHGYDDLGAQYDDYGNLRNWWGEETMTTFQKKKQCFIAQYGNKIEPTTERRADGRITIGENIADNGGLRIAYEAYQRKLAREKELRTLPGLSQFSQNQLFFLAYANTWCESLKSSAIEYLIDTDVHSLGMFRVNVPLQNFPAFSKAFECPIGSGMNPFEKCRIW
ncbi:unnamed protein product [Auanema sp. JU1783]|nr:unnamed protein product [Auanema sp. JU1783]